MTRTGEGADGPWVDDVGLAAALSDAVAVLDPAGTIAWVNDAFCRLVGQDRSELLGVPGLDRVHPDELERAIDGIDYASRFPGQTAVAPYRIRAGDGSWIPVELKSGTVTRPDGEHLVLVVRDGTPRLDVYRALHSVANGEPLAVTAVIIAEAIGNRWPGSGVTISVGLGNGEREELGPPLPGLLADHAAGRLGHLGLVAPWDLVAPGDVVVTDGADLPEPLRAAARAAGFEGVGVAAVPDPAGPPACLVAWFAHTVIGRLEYRHAAAELTELLGLALERRHHHVQLWHVASHDPLTGLLNRTGFFDRFAPGVAADRTAGLVTALLFVDLDGLKAVNDRGGHAAGDRLLVDVAARLRTAVGSSAHLARLGGDEFVVTTALAREGAPVAAETLAQAVVDALAAPGHDARWSADGRSAMAASVGIALDDGTEAPVRILERADAAMYRAKDGGRSRWAW